MCGHEVMDHVRRAMLSRRSLVFGAAAGAATHGGAAMGAEPPTAAVHGSYGAIVDLTHTLSADFPTWTGEPQFERKPVYSRDKDGFNLSILTVDEHTGTHVDAPLHYSDAAQSVDEIPVGNLIAPLVVVDIAERAADDPDTALTPDDLRAFTARHGPIPEHACVAMHCGWAARVRSDAFRNADADGTMHFPGIHPEAAALLMEETSAIGLAVDTMSLDIGASEDFATHNLWLPTNRWGVECVAGLAALPPVGATMILGAPKHRGGSGGPARVFALLPA